MRLKRAKVGKRVVVELSHRERLHYDPHLDDYWIVTLMSDGTEHVGSPFSVGALDGMYNDSWA